MGGIGSCRRFGNACVLRSELGDFGFCLLFRWDGTVLVVPPFLVYGDDGWRVPCKNVAGESDYMVVGRGTVFIREGELLNYP